jgi:hypothetical protein
MTVTAHNPTTPRKQRVRTPSLVIIEFVLGQLPHMGTAGQLLHLSLMQNYAVEPGRLHYEEVVFELNTPGALEKHTKEVVKLVGRVKKRYVNRCTCFPTTQNKVTGDSTTLCSSSTPIPTTLQATYGTAPLMPIQGSLQLHPSIMYFALCSCLSFLIPLSSFLRQSSAHS